MIRYFQGLYIRPELLLKDRKLKNNKKHMLYSTTKPYYVFKV